MKLRILYTLPLLLYDPLRVCRLKTVGWIVCCMRFVVRTTENSAWSLKFSFDRIAWVTVCTTPDMQIGIHKMNARIIKISNMCCTTSIGLKVEKLRFNLCVYLYCRTTSVANNEILFFFILSAPHSYHRIIFWIV